MSLEEIQVFHLLFVTYSKNQGQTDKSLLRNLNPNPRPHFIIIFFLSFCTLLELSCQINFVPKNRTVLQSCFQKLSCENRELF